MASPQRTPEFRAEAVRIALTNGLSRKEVAADPLPGRVLRSNIPGGLELVFQR